MTHPPAGLLALLEKLQRPDPLMLADEYGEGYTDGKAAAARLVGALIAETPAAPEEGDRVRLTYGDGSFVEGTWRAVLEKDDGTLHTHTRGQVRRDVIS